MTDYPIKINFKDPNGGVTKARHLRQCGAFEDDSLVLQMAGPDGKPNEKAIWIARIVRDFDGMTDDTVRKLSRWEMETLVYFWKKYNDMDIGIFLEERKESELPKEDTSSIQS